MSFTDQKPWVATEKDCHARWDGMPNGEYFRCKLCGYKFKPGDTVRFVFGGPHTNVLVCQECDTGNEDVRKKWDLMHKEMKTKYWYFWSLIND
mgnify:CR=1 FL=1